MSLEQSIAPDLADVDIDPAHTHEVQGPTTYVGTSPEGFEWHDSRVVDPDRGDIPDRITFDDEVRNLDRAELLRGMKVSVEPTMLEVKRAMAEKRCGMAEALVGLTKIEHKSPIGQITVEELGVAGSLAEVMADRWIQTLDLFSAASPEKKIQSIILRATGPELPVVADPNWTELSTFGMHTDNHMNSQGLYVPDETEIDVFSYTAGVDSNRQYDNGLLRIDGMFKVYDPSLVRSRDELLVASQSGHSRPVSFSGNRGILYIPNTAHPDEYDATVERVAERQVSRLAFARSVHAGSFYEHDEVLTRVNTGVIYE